MTWDLIHGDCLEVMAGMPDASVDAVVTDPPYCAGGVGEASRSAAKGHGRRSETISRFGWFVGDNMTTAGLAFLLHSVAFAARRILKPSGHLLCFMDWRMAPTMIPALESGGLRYQSLIVWDKDSFGLGVGFRHRYELVAHFTNGAPEYHARDVGDLIVSKRVGADRTHQTQKPIMLMRELIRVVCPPGGLVVDPFAGSGSTCVAALVEGRECIGIEREAEYVEIARRRIEEDAPLFNRTGDVA